MGWGRSWRGFWAGFLLPRPRCGLLPRRWPGFGNKICPTREHGPGGSAGAGCGRRGRRRWWPDGSYGTSRRSRLKSVTRWFLPPWMHSWSRTKKIAGGRGYEKLVGMVFGRGSGCGAVARPRGESRGGDGSKGQKRKKGVCPSAQNSGRPLCAETGNGEAGEGAVLGRATG